MMWPFRKIDTSTPDRPDVAAAERDLERTRAQTEHYRRLGDDLRRIRRENHLAQAFLQAAIAHQRGDQ